MSQGVHYVYVLFRENGLPFYVGMGKGQRWTVHERRAHKRETHKDHIIADMQARGVKLHKVKVHENLTRDAAIDLEIGLIAAIGRECHGGPLINQTSGGDGVPDLPREVYLRIGQTVGAQRRGVPLDPVVVARIRATKQANGRSRKQIEQDEIRKAGKRDRLARIAAEKEEARVRDGLLPGQRRGSPKSLQTREKIRAAHKGKKRSPEQAAQCYRALQNLTDEQKERRRQSLLATNARKRALRTWQPLGGGH